MTVKAELMHFCTSDTSNHPSIGVGRFRILGGGARFRILRGPNSQQAHDVVMTSMRRNDVASASFRRHMPSRFLINQCQIIAFLILKSDTIENSRIPSNQIKVAFIIILPFNLVYLWIFPVSHRNWRKRWMDYWGPKGMLPPTPLKLLGGGGCPPPPGPSHRLPTSMPRVQSLNKSQELPLYSTPYITSS